MGAWWRAGAAVAVVGGVVALLVWHAHQEATEPKAGWVTEKVLHPEVETETCQTVNGVHQCHEVEYEEWYEVRYCNDAGDCGDAAVDWDAFAAARVGEWFAQ